MSRLVLTFLGLIATSAATAQPSPDAPGSQPALPPALVLDIRTSRTFYEPGQPLHLQFLVTNRSAEPVDVELGQPAGVGLSDAFLRGAPSAPALLLRYGDEQTIALPTSLSQEAATTIRLAAGAVIGAEIDLAATYREIRYAGDYTLEWRPMNGKYGSAQVDFRVEPRQSAVIVTDHGKILIELDYEGAPRNVSGFLELARGGFYDNLTFHRLAPGFLIQGGDPTGAGRGVRPDGRMLPAEFSDEPFDLGTVAMARKPSDKNSASCQFFITLGRQPELDGQYTIIGSARDAESLRTLERLGAQATDNKGVPRRTLRMNSVSLIDADRLSPAAAER